MYNSVTSHFKIYYYTISYEIQTLKMTQIMQKLRQSITMLEFYTSSTSYWQCYRIGASFAQAAYEDFHERSQLDTRQQKLRHHLVSAAGNIGVRNSRSNSPNLNLVAYIICDIINSMSTCVFKMSINWRCVCWLSSSAWNTLLTVQ